MCVCVVIDMVVNRRRNERLGERETDRCERERERNKVVA